MAPINSIALDRALVGKANNSLYEFVKMGWHIVENIAFTEGRTPQVICDCLEAVSEGHIKKLIVNVPPGSTKSLIVQVFWPTWDWIEHNPGRKWIFGSYDATLTRRDASRALTLIQSPWFIDRWGYILRDSHPAASEYWTAKGGMRFATSVKGKAMGRHGDIRVVDDPIKPKDALGGVNASKVALDECETWWEQTMATRVTNPETSAAVIIMQRVHANDLAGLMIRKGGYHHLRLPMRFEEKNKCIMHYQRTHHDESAATDEEHKASAKVVDIVGGDWRIESGELMWPERFTLKGVEILEEDLKSPAAISAQLQQAPTPAGGLIFKEKWIGYYHPKGANKLDPHSRPCVPLPVRGGLQILSLDAAFKGSDGSDRCSMGCWLKHGPNHYLLDNDTDVYEFVDMLTVFTGMIKRHPLALEKLIEDKANGSATISMLKNKVSGLTAIEPAGGKIDRANASAPLFKGGNVYVPHPELASWVTAYVRELTTFPFGEHDDQVDMTTQALLHLQSGAAVFEAAMARAFK